MMTSVVEFAFILALPLVIVAGAVVSLFAVGALFDALDHLDELGARIDAAFKRPPSPPKDPGPDHYYRSYWAEQK
jgi:hypothetical protein